MEASIEGQSTFGMVGTNGAKVEKLQIVETASALRWKLNMVFLQRKSTGRAFFVLVFAVSKSLLTAQLVLGPLLYLTNFRRGWGGKCYPWNACLKMYFFQDAFPNCLGQNSVGAWILVSFLVGWDYPKTAKGWQMLRERGKGAPQKVRVFYERKDPQHTLFCPET